VSREILDFWIDPRAVPGPHGFAVATRTGDRGIEALERMFGRAIWDGGDGTPELNRQGTDPRRPWM